MIRPKIGLLVFSESAQREDVYLKRKPISDREITRFVERLSPGVDIVWPKSRELRNRRQALSALRELQAASVEAIVLYIPIFVSPALVAHTANQSKVPLALVCNDAEDSLSELAFLATAGAMDQIGLSYLRQAGDIRDNDNLEKLLRFLRASAAANLLRGQTFGCIGGRALGISSGTADLSLWERTFGVDIEHVDQFELVRRADNIDADEVKRHVCWIEKQAGSVQFNETNFTRKHLEKQIRSYLATRAITKEYELDFIGVKCQPDLSNSYCLQCLNVCLCNDAYDAEGPKETVACSCEADADGALTMQVLKLLSGGKPTCLNDIAAISETEMTGANCGAMASYFASLSDSYEKNLGNMNLVPHSFGAAGGAATSFTVPKDQEMTFARFFRKKDRYFLGVLTGTTMKKDLRTQSETIRIRPLLFAKINIDKNHFMETFGSNHILAVPGNYKGELGELCKLLDIHFLDYDIQEDLSVYSQ